MSSKTIIIIYLVLMGLSFSHILYGKDGPKIVWQASLALSLIAGMFLGLVTLPLPEGLLAGLVFAFGGVIINLMTKSSMKHW